MLPNMPIRLRGHHRVVLAIVLATLRPHLASAQTPAPGTYRVWLCAAKCTLADSSRAIGMATVVVFGESAEQRESSLALLHSLRVIRRTERGQLDNVCFYASRSEPRVAGEEFFFGIQANGLTRWLLVAPDQFSITVYASPDAGYALRWLAAGEIRAGEGWSYGWAGNTPYHRNAFFVAQRLGDPDPKLNLNLTRFGGASISV